MVQVNSTLMEFSNILDAMKTIGERVKQARLSAQLSQEQLARLAGVTQGLIGQIEGGRNKGTRHVASLARALNVSADWLESGAGPQQRPIQGTPHEGGVPLSYAPAYNAPTEGDNFEPGPDLKPRLYPEISWVQAGMWTELCENFTPDEGTVWHQCHIDLGPCGFVVSVRGPSMTAPPGIHPSFPEGIKLFVSPDAEALPGKYVIVRRNNKATFKKLTIVDGDLYLEALNPDWPDRYTPLQPGDHFCGVIRHAGFDL